MVLPSFLVAAKKAGALSGCNLMTQGGAGERRPRGPI